MASLRSRAALLPAFVIHGALAPGADRVQPTDRVRQHAFGQRLTLGVDHEYVVVHGDGGRQAS
jgi:hypothetical protein